MSTLPSSIHSDYELADAEFHEIRRIVHRITGIALADSKKHLVHGRLVRRLRALRLDSFAQYLKRIEDDANELEEFCNAITTNLTSFFPREPPLRVPRGNGAAAPAASQRDVEADPDLVGRLLDRGGAVLHCHDGAGNARASARLGHHGFSRPTSTRRFSRPQAEGTTRPIDSRRCHARAWNAGSARGVKGFTGRLPPSCKRLITFKRLNLIEQWPVRGPFDVIFCRNVVIYFDKPTQRVLFRAHGGPAARRRSSFHRALRVPVQRLRSV
jgi:chemotaxis protein methyltransferase CheR